MRLSSKSRGQIAQLKIELESANRGYVISRPSVDCYYDVLIDTVKSIIRCQIKYCNRRSSSNKANLELRLDNHGTKRIFYSKTMVDYIFVYLPQKDIILKYEQKQFHRKKTIQINLTNPSSKWHFSKFIW